MGSLGAIPELGAFGGSAAAVLDHLSGLCAPPTENTNERDAADVPDVASYFAA